MYFLLVALAALWGIIYYFHRLYRKCFIQDFSKKRVFITGTDSGFGKRLAVDLDRKGVIVYAGCYTENGAQELTNAASKRLKVVRLDVSDANSVSDARKIIENDIPPNEGLWGLVNNAGIITGLCFDFCTVEDYKKILEVNFFGVIRVTETFLPLIKRSRGRIVTVISIFSRGNVAVPAYCCSKYALQPYCDGLRRSLKTFGIHAAIIEPGYFPSTALTRFKELHSQYEKEWANLPESIKKEYGEKFKETFFKKLWFVLSNWPFSKQNGANLNFVTDAMQHALGAVHPKARYLCGSDARPYVGFTSVLPDWILDPIARYAASYGDVAAKR